MTMSSTIGKGILAGLAGTAAMTASSMIEARMTGRPPSTTPADAVERVVGIEPEGQEEEQRLSNLAHWAYGTGWGLPRAMLGAIGLSQALATAAHFLAVWGAELIMLPRLGITPPASEWKQGDLLKDAWHHAVYATAAGITYSLLDRRERERMPSTA